MAWKLKKNSEKVFLRLSPVRDVPDSSSLSDSCVCMVCACRSWRLEMLCLCDCRCPSRMNLEVASSRTVFICTCIDPVGLRKLILPFGELELGETAWLLARG